MIVQRIVSGAQTGVDRAALDVAIELGIACGGWCPAGRRAEDGRIADRYPVSETPTARYDERTRWNVRDSDATLILAREPLTGGTLLTRTVADREGKPVLVVDPADLASCRRVADWLGANAVATLNVAGPRESTQPGAHAAAAAFLRGLLAAPQPSVRRPLAVLAVYWAALIPAFAVWLWRDRTYAPWDPAYHSYLVMRLHDGLVRGNVWRFYELDRFYPPLFHALAVPASFFSDHPDAFAFGNWLALLALLCATWATAAPLAGADAALAAAFLVPGYAYVAWMCRMAMTDLTQAATVAATLALLVRPAPLAARRDARRLGIAIALGMLAKWSYAFFAGPPIAAAVVSRLREAGPAERRRTLWALAPLVVWPLVLAGPWYVRSLPYIASRLGWHLGAEVAAAEGDPPPLSVAALDYYADALSGAYMTWPTWALLLTSATALAWSWWRDPVPAVAPPRRWSPLLVSAAAGFACLVAIANKDPRYLLSIVPVIAVVSGAWVAFLEPPARRRALVACAVLGYGLALHALFVADPPDPTEWRLVEAAHAIADDMASSGRRDAVLVVPNDEHMNFMSVDYAIERRLRDKVQTDRVTDPLDAGALAPYGYAIVVLPPPPESVLSRGSIAASAFVPSQPGWSAIASFARGDGREVRVLRRDRP
ncbi:MAG TPA: putative molybdenum carrier protein [Candidatus Binatia bacterium]|nr:putative molybdenum carrier protein [Candidatus Binatia bacterium]